MAFFGLVGALGLLLSPTPLHPRVAIATCRASNAAMNANLPRNLKEMVQQLKEAMQASLSGRQSRLAVEMPLGFEFGVEGQKAKRKGGAKLLTSDDVVRSDRELSRLFVGMFEGTGLIPLILFSSEAEAAAAKRQWDAPGLEARVQALMPPGQAAAPVKVTSPAKAKAASSGGGGFGGGGGGGFGGGATSSKKGKKGSKKKATEGPPPLSKVPPSAEVVIAVAPGEGQLRVLQDFCSESGMDKLVIVLNARLDAAGGAEGEPKSDDIVEYFEDCGDGGFQTSFAFVTQPLGVGKAGSSEAADQGDPLVLYRRYPDEWVFARKPAIGPPKYLLTQDADEGRPSVGELRAAVDGEAQGLEGFVEDLGNLVPDLGDVKVPELPDLGGLLGGKK